MLAHVLCPPASTPIVTPEIRSPLSGRPESNRADRGRRIDRGDRIRAVTSTDAAANGLATNTELCGNGSQAKSASLVDGADGRTPHGMDGWSTDRLSALGALGLGPRHAGQHALA